MSVCGTRPRCVRWTFAVAQIIHVLSALPDRSYLAVLASDHADDGVGSADASERRISILLVIEMEMASMCREIGPACIGLSARRPQIAEV